MKRIFAAVALASLTACSTAPRIAQEVSPVRESSKESSNETIYRAAVVAAGPQQTPQVDTAILVRDGRVVELGASATLRAAHPGARWIDAGQATILPGLTDAHGHLYGLGLALDTVDLVGASSADEMVRRVAARAATTSRGDWIVGRGWDQNRWPDKAYPTAAELDAAVTDHPVWLQRIDGHAAVGNSAALRAAGITAATHDPAGGRILRDASGKPTGVFIDAATALVDAKVPPPSQALRKARVLKAAQAIAAEGLVEMHDAGADDETIAAAKELVDEGKLPIRLYLMLSDEQSDDPETPGAALSAWMARGPLLDYGGRLTVRSIKLYADGALGSRGAALLAPYSDEPGNTGLVIATPEHLLAVSRRALAAGFQVNTHAIGDRGVRNVIDAYEKAGTTPEKRFRIEHLQVISPDDLPRLAPLGIIASMQPTHATSDMPWAEQRLGPERIKGAYAWRSVLNSGARLALGSDFPVEYVNPFFGIHSAVTRQDHEGTPAGGWYPDQKLTLHEAIRGFTSDAAYAAFEETSRGTIEPGKLADFTIVEGDFYTTPPAELYRTRVKFTVVGGEIVYMPSS